jgi:hypothetical protein
MAFPSKAIPSVPYVCIYTYTAAYRITYSVVTLSYDNYYANLRGYSNSVSNYKSFQLAYKESKHLKLAKFI